MQIKTKILLASALITGVTTFSPSIAFAASDTECAIWLCLPAGFPSSPAGAPSSMTCSDAKRAMIDRIKDAKSPLPAFNSCLAPGQVSSTMKAENGTATYVPPHKICEQWGGGDAGECIKWRTVPEQWVKGRPQICQTQQVACQHLRWVEVFADGKKTGGTYYFNTNGQGKLIGGDDILHQNLEASK